jgi:hypothetical protein
LKTGDKFDNNSKLKQNKKIRQSNLKGIGLLLANSQQNAAYLWSKSANK